VTAVNQSPSRSIAAAVLLVILATATACTRGSGATSNSGETSSPGTHSTSTTATSLPTISTAEDEVLQAYTAFWKALPVAARLSEGPREELLRKHLVSPALANVLASLASQAAFKKRLYGQNVPKPEVSALTATTATVEDCQENADSCAVSSCPYALRKSLSLGLVSGESREQSASVTSTSSAAHGRSTSGD